VNESTTFTLERHPKEFCDLLLILYEQHRSAVGHFILARAVSKHRAVLFENGKDSVR
jgi:hypothetical protein